MESPRSVIVEGWLERLIREASSTERLNYIHVFPHRPRYEVSVCREVRECTVFAQIEAETAGAAGAAGDLATPKKKESRGGTASRPKYVPNQQCMLCKTHDTQANRATSFLLDTLGGSTVKSMHTLMIR